MIYLPWFIRTAIIESMNTAEKLKKSPANVPEICVVAVQDFRFWEG
jgi:hypothetical protein